MVEGPHSCDDLLLTVRDVWHQDQWDLNMISLRLPAKIVQQITGISISWFCEDDDLFVWNSNSEIFCSTTAYRLNKNPTATEPLMDWSWVWKINAHLRVVYFFWIALQNRLATKEFLHTRHITHAI